MRIASLGTAAALALICMSTSLSAQRADDQIDSRSAALVAKGKALFVAGNFDGATDTLETALAVDPRNRPAFLVLAEVAEARTLPGKAIRLYREALLLEPNDVEALKGQGEALVAKGAVERAKQNLASIKKICAASACPQATALAAVIAKGPPPTQAAQVVPAKPVTRD